MRAMQKIKKYKSPPHKLVNFFEKSRNQWKAKCCETKAAVKGLKNKIRFLKKSKERWKSRVKELEAEVARIKANKGLIENELEEFKKKASENQRDLKCTEDFALVPFHHKYSVGHIMLFISLILSASASFRCASCVIKILMSSFHLSLPSPSWFSGRLWLLRIGYYKLMRSKNYADDWVWIVDHTVQVGKEKCLVILGIHLSSLPCPDRCLTHEDVEPIAMFPVQESNGEIVYQQLEETIQKTGIPREIIGDHGSDLKSGINKFCREHPETCYVYDIKHKTAAVLKKELQYDESWHEFTQLAVQTKKKVQQTSLAFLSPPNQRTKARYMNIDVLIRWGGDMLAFFEEERKGSGKYDRQELEEKLGWITEFRDQIGEWGELHQIMATTEQTVRKEGIYRGSHRKLKELLTCETHTERAKKVCKELLHFVAKEEMKTRAGERLLGSSEVIESIFGKLKRLEQDQSKSGFTGLLLSIAAMVSETTKSVVQKAMEKVSTKSVLDWCKKNIGQSIQTKRKEAFACRDKTEQKWDQLKEAA